MTTLNSTRFCRYCCGPLAPSTTIGGETSLTCVSCGHEVEASTADHSTLDTAGAKARRNVASGRQVAQHGDSASVESASTAGRLYTVVSGRCTCQAGQHGRRCWHVAAVAQKAA